MTSQLDFFAPAAARLAQTERGRKTGARDTIRKTGSDDEALAAYLESTGNYRVLRKLQPRPVIERPRADFRRQGVILDTETTGLNHRADEIIEIGVITFTFDDAGMIGDVTGVYGGLRQPANAIPEDITRLTGITDEMVEGQSIDIEKLTSLVSEADLIIAHNAGFDRPFCEAFLPVFRDKAWACSVKEIDWAARGFEGTKLGYLVGQSGYFHDGHRAVDDCFALLEVLCEGRPGQSETPFAELHQASQRSRVRLFAENSPFDMKDHLKKRGYRWSDGSDGRPKSWWVELPEETLDDELHFLRTEIYRWDADPTVKHLTAFDRFKAS